MAKMWDVLAVPEGVSGATALEALAVQAGEALRLVPPAHACKLLRGLGRDGRADEASLGALLRGAAFSAPPILELELGEIRSRPAPDGFHGLVEIYVDAHPSSELAAFLERLRPAASSLDLPHVVLGTCNGSAWQERQLERLAAWWQKKHLHASPALTFGAVALADASGACPAKASLGRAGAVARGLSLLGAAPPPQPAHLTRARSEVAEVPAALPEVPSPKRPRRSASQGALGVAGAQGPRGPPTARARCAELEEGVWAVSLSLSADHPARRHRTPTRFHFVLDNSGSMGRSTGEARACFSELLHLASGPCSLTVFDAEATVLGESFLSPAAMRAVPLPRQGQTNISAGVEAAVDVIARCEREAGSGRTHHVLVLLSDGQHNRGPKPEGALPEIGAALRSAWPALRLSVVVVGVTSNSSTSVGMLLKESLETAPLPSLQPIYFAQNMRGMQDALAEMQDGLASLQGSLVRVSAVSSGSAASESKCRLVRTVGEAPPDTLSLPASDGTFPLLCIGRGPPIALLVDGELVAMILTPAGPKAFDSGLVADALQRLMDGARQRRIAYGETSARPALEQLERWTAALERRLDEQRAAPGADKLRLARAGPQSRIAQHKAAVRCLHGARELRNQLAEIDALRTNDSATQAAFLNGARSKYGAKALRRSGARCAPLATGGAGGFHDVLSDLQRVAPRMRAALREDLCAKLAALDPEARQRLRQRLSTRLPTASRASLDALCSGACGAAEAAGGPELAALASSAEVVRQLSECVGGACRSFVSLQSAWEHLSEWCDAAEVAASVCGTEYELLMYLGAMGLPLDMKRRAATQMNPYAVDVDRVRTAPADSASLCCALKSEQVVVPPEGGVAVEDLLVLVDPDWPRASKLACGSKLLGEVYISVVLCRDLHMFTGKAMHIALHAHALLAAVQPAPATRTPADLEAQLRRQYLGRAYQCGACRFGPIDHFNCGDLTTHHSEVEENVRVDNSCPQCGWFAETIGEWPTWDGTVPASAEGPVWPSTTGPTAASVGAALRICYSARATWRPDASAEAHELCDRLAQLETLTTADGVDHPVKLLLALAACDEVSDDALAMPPAVALLGEVCARRARDDLCSQTGSTEQPLVMKAARGLVAGFLGVEADSAPETLSIEEAEPPRGTVQEACGTHVELDDREFDFVAWVQGALRPWLGALLFVRRLRRSLRARGGWEQLGRDLETGPAAYEDVVAELCAAPGELGALSAWLGVEERDMPRVCATMAAQAFLHNNSQLRRTSSAGGSLEEPLGDVRDRATLRGLAVELRMEVYSERVATKMQEWHRVGTCMVIARARAADLGQYADMCGGGHVHGLNKETFWGLWRAAKADGHDGLKVKEFLSRANRDFINKHGKR